MENENQQVNQTPVSPPVFPSAPILQTEKPQQPRQNPVYGGLGWRKKIVGKNPKQNGYAAIMLALISIIFPGPYIFGFAAALLGGAGIYYAKRDKLGTGIILLNFTAVFLGLLSFFSWFAFKFIR